MGVFIVLAVVVSLIIGVFIAMCAICYKEADQIDKKISIIVSAVALTPLIVTEVILIFYIVTGGGTWITS